MATLTAAQKKKIRSSAYKNESTLSKIRRNKATKSKNPKTMKKGYDKKKIAKKALKKVPIIGPVLTAASLAKNAGRAIKTTIKNKKMVSEKELNAAIKKGVKKVNNKIKGPIEKGHKKGVAKFKKKVENAPVPAWAKKAKKQNKVKVKKSPPVVKGPSKVTKKQKQTKKPIKKTNISNAVVGGGAAVSALTLSGGKGKKGSSISKQKSNPNATPGQHSTSSRHTPLTAKSTATKKKATKSGRRVHHATQMAKRLMGGKR